MEENNNTLDAIRGLPYFYSLVDYEEFNNVTTCIEPEFNKGSFNRFSNIGILFEIGKQSREIFVRKSVAKKAYSFFQIIHDYSSINVIVKKGEDYSGINLLKKINSKSKIKGFIHIYLKISEFPLKNYILEEIYQKNEDFDKIFLLKNKFSNQTNDQQLKTIAVLNSFNNQNQNTNILNLNNKTYNNSNTNSNANNLPQYNNGYNNYNNNSQNEINNLKSELSNANKIINDQKLKIQ